MKNIKYLFQALFLSATIMLTGCEDENLEFGDIIVPTNVEILKADIEGQDENDPELINGDGSGFVTFESAADNVISYSYDFGDGISEIAPSGMITHRYTKVGVNTFTVVVSAIGTAGVTSTTSMDLEVYSSFSDVEAIDFLSDGAGNSKTWYWAADKAANIGLGPDSKQGDGSHTWPAWFASEPWHSDKLCMYDSEFVFTQSADGGLTFEQTVGLAYVPGTYAGNLGVDGDTCHGADVVPSLIGIKNVALIPSTSAATEDAVDPEYRGTTISFSDGGFMGYYVGASTIEIIEITNSTLYVRLTEPGFAWYARYQTEKPVQ